MSYIQNLFSSATILRRFILIILTLVCHLIQAQNNKALKWWNPAEEMVSAVEGQVWMGAYESPYDRLPTRMKDAVREPLWNLSKHSAGLMIRFKSNSPQIKIRYELANNQHFAMNHMPATGVSGMDLYAIDSDGKELWCAGSYRFAEKSEYNFQGLNPNDAYHKQGREYRLYLPLYNQVKSLEIGVENSAIFEVLPPRRELPIVLYGTSIAQGACASRPGMAWSTLVQKKLDRPLVNLGFSGNGRLEEPLIDLMTEIEAKIYILDCLPNMTHPGWKRLGIENEDQFKERVQNAVELLKRKRPDTPILLVDHAGHSDASLMTTKKEWFGKVNRLQKEVYEKLVKEGIKDLYYLSYSELRLGQEDMVDGVHPNDLGMWHYAKAYTSKLRTILKEPAGSKSTTIPVSQSREPQNYSWEDRHNEILKINKTLPPKSVILANSIIHFWGGKPKSKFAREDMSWKELFNPMGIGNYAFGWDRIENVLWRIYHEELDGFEAEKILVMIGTNNLHINTDAEILEGLNLLIAAIQKRQPKAQVYLMGLLPRRDAELRISGLNLEIENLAGKLAVNYRDLGAGFLKSDGFLDEELFSDGLHPNRAGYLILREALLPILEE